MKIKDIGKIKDISDLREMNTNDVIELLDELRAIATKRGTELLGQGKHQARKAIGASDEGAVGGAFMFGILLGAAVAVVVTMLMTPMPGREARRRLTEEVERVRERVPAARPDGDGRSIYERERVTPSAEVGTTGGSLSTPTA